MLKEITVLKLVGGEYQQSVVYRAGDQAVSVLLPGFGVDVISALEAK
jgi:hypothetical protein